MRVTKEKEVNRNCIKKFFGSGTARIICGSLATLAVLAVSGTAFAQDAPDDGEALRGYGEKGMAISNQHRTLSRGLGCQAALMLHHRSKPKNIPRMGNRQRGRVSGMTRKLSVGNPQVIA